MSARRGRRCLAALVSTAAVVVAAGCSATVSGHGSLAAGVRTPGGDLPGGPGDDQADRRGGGPGDRPSGSPSPTPSQVPDRGDDGGGKICPLFSTKDLATIFGQPVTTSDKGDDSSCEFQTAHSGGVLVNVYDFLNMRQEAARDPGGTSLSVAGRPAYQGKRELLVARSSSSSAAGLIIASNLFFDDEARGNQIAKKLLEKIVPKFTK